MAPGVQPRNRRRSPRIDVLLRVKGELAPVGSPVTILNVNRTGFALLSEVWFRPGARVELRMMAINGPSVQIAGIARQAQPVQRASGLYMTGFSFEPVRYGGTVPEDDIRRLIEAVAPEGFKV